MSELSEIAKALSELNKDEVEKLVNQQLENKVSPIEIVKELNLGLDAVGVRFSTGEYFLSELMYSSHIMKGIMTSIEPLLGDESTSSNTKNKVLIGTVKGDIHDIGKNIVITLLKGAGFEVIDLGVDVPAETFINAVKEYDAKVLGLSCLLNVAFDEMKNVTNELEKNGLREKVKVLIGGQPTDEEIRKYVNADYCAIDAVDGVNICKDIYAA